MKLTYVKLSLVCFLACTLYMLSCTKDKAIVKPIINTVDTVSFNEIILPLMNTNCSTSGCHDSGTAQSGYVYTDYTTISENAVSALEAMMGTNNRVRMPLGSQLDEKSINNFNAWIAQGKLNN